jgi:antitoxin ParD1/3/4
MAMITITLPDEMEIFIESQVATGMYSDASDYIRAALREDFRKREALIAALEEGEASGVSPYTIEEIFERAKRRHLSRAA